MVDPLWGSQMPGEIPAFQKHPFCRNQLEPPATGVRHYQFKVPLLFRTHGMLPTPWSLQVLNMSRIGWTRWETPLPTLCG